MSLVYPELRRIARKHLKARPAGESRESAAVANEAYLKLVRARGLRCESRVHFLALCSQIIRRILVDHARKRGYAKRGGGAVHIPLGEEVVATGTRHVEVLALDEALASLSKCHHTRPHYNRHTRYKCCAGERKLHAKRISHTRAKRAS